MDFDDIEEEEFFAYMLDNEYIVHVGYDIDGDPTYKMTSKMIEYYPEVFEHHLAFTNNLIFDLWTKGLVEVTMLEDGTWNILPNSKTRNFEDFASDLSKEEWALMDEINRMIDEKDDII